MKACKHLFLTLLVLVLVNANALQIRSYNPVTHDRFSSGYPANPVPNTSPSFIADSYDLSGVGWKKSNPDFSFALVTPQHFLGANHAKPALSDSLRFVNTDGILKSFGINKIYTIKNDSNQAVDLFVGELKTAITPTDKISYYNVADYPTEEDYVDLPILAYGKTARIGAGTIDLFGNLENLNDTRAFAFVYDKNSGEPDDYHGEGGDSGSPSFIVENEELVVVGTHSALINDTTNNVFLTVDAFVPHYLDKINAAIAPSGYQVNAPLPVTLSRFSAEAKPDFSVFLQWTTASEKDNKGFQIERGMEEPGLGISWSSIGFVQGNGTTTTKRQYHFLDKSPLEGINYYRLRQVDWDEKFTYSSVVKAFIERAKKELTLFPNPVSDRLYLSGTGAATTFRIIDRQGVVLYNGQADGSVSVEDLPAGVYTLQTNSGWAERFVKL